MKTKITLLIIFSALTSFAQPWYIWTQKTPPPFGTNGRILHDLFSINGLVYLAMGSDSGALNTYNDLWEYDPGSDTWSQKAVFPYQGSYSTSSFVINNEAYVVGGWWRQGTNTNHLISCNYKYTPATNTFTAMTAFPDADRYTGASFMLNGKGYFGTGYAPLANDLWEYDPTAGTWTQKASMPGAARQGATGFAIGNYGYITTGNNAAATPTVYTDTWRYDPVANSWLQKASFPGAPRSYCSVMVLNNEAFLIGGTNFVNTAYNQVYKYNPVSDSWLFIGVFPGGGRYSSRAETANGKGYFGQGSYSNQALLEWWPVNDWWEFEIVTGVGIDEKENGNLLNIYPNPASTEITLNAGTGSLPSQVSVYDIGGQLMTSMKPSTEKIKIDISGYPRGNYIVQAFSGKKVITQKFVKE